MKIQRLKTQLALVGVVALGLGLTPNAWSYCGTPQCALSGCTTGSIGNPGTLSKTNETICVGGSVSAPSVSGTTTNNGSKQVLCWDYCQSWYNYYPVYYRLTNWFEPAIPGSFTNGGTFVFTNKVRGLSTDADCPGATAVVTVGTFTVTVISVAPTIPGQPTNQVVCQGGSATFCVTASGSAPLSYQWRFNGTNLTGATGVCYTKTNVQPGDAGSYSVVVTNPCGSVLSSNAVLTVMGPTYDGDSDGLPDCWELAYFGDLSQTGSDDHDGDGLNNLQEYQLGTNPTNWDTDGDGLSDSEELDIPVDINNPALGDLDPLNPDTGNTGTPDGEKDSDHDGITNLGELRHYMSDPANARTFNPYKLDSEYFHSGRSGESGLTMVTLSVVNAGGGLLRITVSGAFANAAYDLYFKTMAMPYRWQWRRVLSGIQCDGAGQAVCLLQQPDPSTGLFVVLSSEDEDKDGLTDGYEAWFYYNNDPAKRTVLDLADSDGDLMWDGWEVEYGLNPTVATGNDGPNSNPDGDRYSNKEEHDSYYAPPPGDKASSFDPLKVYNTPNNRPVVTISATDTGGDELGDTATFTIRRSVGKGGSLSSSLIVYYTVGGTARYGSDYDYTLTPAPNTEAGDPGHPDGYPRIFLAKIQPGAETVDVTVTPIADAVAEGRETVIVTLTPYSVSPATQVSDPTSWAYVVDWNHNRVTNYIFDAKGLGQAGIMVNLEQQTGSGYLRIKPTADTSPMPFVNVANTDRGTVARIKVEPNPDPAIPSTWSSVFGEYYTAPDNRGRNSSRTTVDRYGNVWVGNRDEVDANEGSITEIGVVMGGTRGTRNPANDSLPFISFTPDPPGAISPGEWLAPPFNYNTCIDRNDDGLIHTSSGLANDRGMSRVLAWTDPGSADPLSTALDEAILRYVRVFPTAVRSVAVDRYNDIWVGSSSFSGGNGWQERIDGVTGLPITGQKLNFGSGGYGGLVDGYGTLWSAGYYANGLLRFVPTGSTPPGFAGGIIPGTGSGYGMGIDPILGDVWVANYDSGWLWRFKAEGCWETVPYGSYGLRGVVVDGRGNVWVAQSNGQVVHHLRTSGEYIGAVTLNHPIMIGVIGNRPYGVCVDSQGMVWAVCRDQALDGGPYAMRIDPNRGQLINGVRLGEVVEAVGLGTGAAPYNYSDMSGFVTLGTTQPAGFWDFIEDSTVDNTVWTKVSRIVDTPANTASVLVEVRAANRVTELASWPFVAVQPDGTMPSAFTIKGRYLEVRTTLMHDFCPGGTCSGPELRSLSVQWGAPAAAPQITIHPKNQVATPGQNVTFTVTASGATSYQWLKNGTPIGTATSSTSLTLNDVQYDNAAKYAVRVTGSGSTLQSAEARLHIKGNAPTTPAQPSMSPPSPNPGETVTFTASTTASSASVYYQWRLGQTPIPGAAGQCTPSGGNWIATFILPNAQCINAGDYSVVFWNQYGAVLSPGITLSLPGSTDVTVTPSYVTVDDPSQPITLTATVCFDWVCAQWYKDDVAIPGANGLVYTIAAPITCDELGTYTFEVFDRSWIKREATATVQAATPSVTIESVTLRLNPSTGETLSYTCEESTDYGVSFHSYGPPGQTLVMATDDGTKSGYQYRITAKVGETPVAHVTVSLSASDRRWPYLTVLDVQGGTADVTYQAASPVGVGPWTYQWFKYNSGTSDYDLISGANQSFYTISAVDCAKQGSYRLRASDSCGGWATVDAFLYRIGCP